ncbi:cytochrome b [Flexibacterium corallicola]|uniref:cytochrome b n=1 Tax=Flexibacterium corallicola TaxID=3037259 RepID=UPI00286EBF15|nr:cytochrome b [Pseudovibrio sp. M1P-2-3]
MSDHRSKVQHRSEERAAQLTPYSSPHKWFHWITVIAVFLMVPAGIAMAYMESGPTQNALFDFHRSVGVFLLFFTAIRLIYRVFDVPPPLPASIPFWQKALAQLTQSALYFILIANPLLGWYATSAYGAKINIFGLFTLPSIASKNREIASTLFDYHEALGLILCALVALHILGSIYHLVIAKDGVFERMSFIKR